MISSSKCLTMDARTAWAEAKLALFCASIPSTKWRKSRKTLWSCIQQINKFAIIFQFIDRLPALYPSIQVRCDTHARMHKQQQQRTLSSLHLLLFLFLLLRTDSNSDPKSIGQHPSDNDGRPLRWRGGVRRGGGTGGGGCGGGKGRTRPHGRWEVRGKKVCLW